MSKTERTALFALILIALGLWALVGYKFYRGTWQAPLGPALALPTYPPLPAAATEALMTARAPAGPTATFLPGQPTLTPFIAEGGAPQCSGPLTMTILAIGSDTRAQGYLYGLADVIRLVRVDFVTPRVTVLEFPRDLWVEIPELDPRHGIDHGKLNQAYLYGNKGMGYYTGQGEGPGLLARTLDLNFGVRPEHYIAANMQTFVKLVNVVGGIDVTLPEPVDGRKADQQGRNDLYFEAGEHHLNGAQTLMLARIREQSTFERADHQNLVLCAVRDALLKPANITKIPQFIDTFDGAVQTDLSPQQISQLACLLPNLNGANVSFVSFPREMFTSNRTFDKGVQKEVFILEADFNTLRLYASAFTSGKWPDRYNIPVGTSEPGAASTSPGGFQCP